MMGKPFLERAKIKAGLARQRTKGLPLGGLVEKATFAKEAARECLERAIPALAKPDPVLSLKLVGAAVSLVGSEPASVICAFLRSHTIHAPFKIEWGRGAYEAIIAYDPECASLIANPSMAKRNAEMSTPTGARIRALRGNDNCEG
jgi:hypothetical protein